MAIIDPSVQLGEGVTVGPFVVINKNVVIGDNTEVMAHAHIDSNTTLGRECRIFPSASLGTYPQDITYAGEETSLEIGDKVTVREFVTVNRGTIKDEGVTRIGDGCFLMAYAHVGHDCRIGRNVVMANNLAMSGHVIVDDDVFISGTVGIHQFVHVGTQAYIAGTSRVTKDIPPYMLCQGMDNFRLRGPNIIGLRRKGFPPATIKALRDSFRLIFRTNRLLAEVLDDAEKRFSEFPEVMDVVRFIRASKRGVPRSNLQEK